MGGREFGMMLLLLVVLVSLFFGAGFLPGHTQFSNDGPLGRLVSQCHRLPDAFTGVWEDLNTIGYREQGAMPDVTYGLRYLMGPVLFSKFYIPVALIILGLGAWCFFREAGLAGPACILGGLAATLNSDFFSTACWGVAAHPLTVGLAFFALAALAKTTSLARLGARGAGGMRGRVGAGGRRGCGRDFQHLRGGVRAVSGLDH